jgi:hypothetical protein
MPANQNRDSRRDSRQRGGPYERSAEGTSAPIFAGVDQRYPGQPCRREQGQAR